MLKMANGVFIGTRECRVCNFNFLLAAFTLYEYLNVSPKFDENRTLSRTMRLKLHKQYLYGDQLVFFSFFFCSCCFREILFSILKYNSGSHDSRLLQTNVHITVIVFFSFRFTSSLKYFCIAIYGYVPYVSYSILQTMTFCVRLYTPRNA